MPYHLIYGYYTWSSNKKEKEKRAAALAQASAAQAEYLDLLNASRINSLNDRDAQLLVSNNLIDYNSLDDKYLGPAFGNSSDDYIEVLIYDTQNNFLESGVVESTDYIHDENSGGIKVKTGTVLRKMGYDRGRFKVLYNFLRKMAGSGETVVVNSNGSVINGEIDESEINNSLFIKENKYVIHEISDSRKELRLITQNIKDDAYLRRFYKLGTKETKYQADESPISNIQFVDSLDPPESSKELQFVNILNNDSVFDESMIGGKIIIPNFFVINESAIPTPPNVADYEMDYESTNGNSMRSSFRVVSIEQGTEVRNATNHFGDKYLGMFHEYFEGLSYDDLIVNPVTGGQITSPKGGYLALGTNQYDAYQLGIHLIHTDNGSRNIGDGTAKIYNVWNVQEPFNRIRLRKQGTLAIVDLESTSVFEADSAVEYTWEIFGWDRDGSNNKNKYELARKYDVSGDDAYGDIKIFGSTEIGDNRYADEATDGAGLKATKTVSPEDFDRTELPNNTRPGCRLRIGIYSGDCMVGVQLTIKDNLSSITRTTALPAIILVEN